jgi:membrane associated rhomboid family serine protease
MEKSVTSQTNTGSFPWITAGLILLNLFVFSVTWEKEKHSMKKMESVRKDSALQEQEMARLRNERKSLLKNHRGFYLNDRDDEYKRELRLNELEMHEKKIDLKDMELTISKLREDLPLEKTGYYGIRKFQVWRLVTYQFISAGYSCLLLNLLLLWVLGSVAEERLDRRFYPALYLSCGALSALVMVALLPSSKMPLTGLTVPLCGVLGALAIRYYRDEVIIYLPALEGKKPARRAAYSVDPRIFLAGTIAAAALTILFSGFTNRPAAAFSCAASFALGAAAAKGSARTKYDKLFFLPAAVKAKPVEKPAETGVQQLFKDARKMFEENKTDEAVAILKNIIAREPANAGAYALLLESTPQSDTDELRRLNLKILALSAEKEDSQESMRIYLKMRSSIGKRELSANVMLYLAKIFELGNDPEEAEFLYRKTIEEYSEHPISNKAYFQLAVILSTREDKTEAIDLLQKLLGKPGGENYRGKIEAEIEKIHRRKWDA